MNADTANGEKRGTTMCLFEVRSGWLDERHIRCYVWASDAERALELGRAYLTNVWCPRDPADIRAVQIFPVGHQEGYALLVAPPESLMNAAGRACRELGSAAASLDGTLLEDEISLRAQIEMTREELRKALHDCRGG